MSVMRKKYLNKQKLNQNNKRSIFTLYRTNTGTNNNCNCGVNTNKAPLINKSFYNYHNRITEPWCDGDAYYKKNFKLRPDNDSYIEDKKSCVINDPMNNIKPNDLQYANTMGYCKDGVVIKKPVITKDMQYYPHSKYVEKIKSKCKDYVDPNPKNTISYKKCSSI